MYSSLPSGNTGKTYCKSCKVMMMDIGWDPREGRYFLHLGLIVSCLLAVAYKIAFHVYYLQPVGGVWCCMGLDQCVYTYQSSLNLDVHVQVYVV